MLFYINSLFFFHMIHIGFQCLEHGTTIAKVVAHAPKLHASHTPSKENQALLNRGTPVPFKFNRDIYEMAVAPKRTHGKRRAQIEG